MSDELVVLSLEPWDRVWRRNQYLVDGLLRLRPHLRVLFVEPPRDVLHDRLHGRASTRGAGLRTADGYDGRLRLYQPTKVLPRVAGGWADVVLRRDIRRAAARAGMTTPVLWINDANGAGLARTTGWPSLYDMTDDWLAAARPGRELRRLRRNERVIFEVSREIVVCSTGLQQTRQGLRPLTLIPNAVDVDRYRIATTPPADLPAESTAVYVGTLHEDRLDVPLVAETAERARTGGGTVVLVGPDALSEASRTRLDEAGVRRLGPRAFDEVPAYLQHASVLIVPHVVDRFTDSLDPIKLYEYRAVGRPVIATPVAGFRDLEGARVAEPSRFAEAVATALAGDRAPSVHYEVPDWADRVRDMDAVITRVGAAR